MSVVVKLYLSFFPHIACFFSLSLSLFFFSLPPFSQLFFFFLFVLHSFYKYPCTSFTSPCRSKAKSKKSKNVCRFFCCIFHIAFFCVFQDVNKFFFARRVKTLFAIFSCLSISFGFFSLFSPSFVTIRCVFYSASCFFVFVFFALKFAFHFLVRRNYCFEWRLIVSKDNAGSDTETRGQVDRSFWEILRFRFAPC